MLENDPQANLNREVPVTPTKPKPKQDFQNILAKMLPDLKVECFKVNFNDLPSFQVRFQIKPKDFQAVGEIGDLCFEERGRSDNAARERLSRKILEIFSRTVEAPSPKNVESGEIKSEVKVEPPAVVS